MKIRYTAGVLIAIMIALSCQNKDDEEVFASIVGKWKGTLAEMELKPFGIPIPVKKNDENFSSTIEFRADGTMTLNDGSKTTEGAYQLVNNKLITDIDFRIETIDLSGTYTIEELTATNLVFYKKKKDTLTDPDTGQSISGDIKVTLHFGRI